LKSFTLEQKCSLFMETILKNRTFWLSITLFFMGIAFGYLEHTFYQYVDENGVLIESWFMPLSFLCIFVGSIGMLFVAVQAIWLAIKKVA
jgi:hypothetical protein